MALVLDYLQAIGAMDTQDVQAAQIYFRSLGDDLKKRAAWCAHMLAHMDTHDWTQVLDEFETAWAVKQRLEDDG